MGRDKALLPFDGTPMAVRVANALRDGGCEPVIAIGGDTNSLATLGLATVADRWPAEGPLGGVITALDHFPEHEAVVVAACDLPNLSSATVAKLVDELMRTSPTADVAMAITDRRQPLCAAWRPSAAIQLAAEFAGGGRRLLDALSNLRVVDVAVEAQQLINVNTASDLPG
jgi:molybdopterin-guanine dinucleotide biosynthesis protein A